MILSIHQDRSELTAYFINDDAEILVNSPMPFSWANLYSFPIIQLVRMLLKTLEPSDQIHQDLQGKSNIEEVQAVLDKYEGADVVDFGQGKDHTKYMFLAIWFALLRSLESIQVYGRSLNRLMEDVANGSDKALFDAVKLDHSAIGNEHIQRRISIAELQMDKKFFTRLGNVMKQRPTKQSVKLYPVRYVLALLDEIGQLDTLTQEDAYQLFCIDLELYPMKSEDPAGSLWQFIYRWKNDNRNPYST